MKAKNFWLICILSISLFACGTNSNNAIEISALTLTPAARAETLTSTFTPWGAGTETALADQPPSLTGGSVSLTPLPTFSFPEVTQEVMEKPTDFSPVLYGGKVYDSTFFLLLGGVDVDEWLMPDESVERFSGEVTYSLNSMTQEAKYFLWGKAPKFSQTCGVYTIDTEAGLDEGGFVAVVDGWGITERPVTELSAEGDFYRQVVTDWLMGEGVENPQVGTLQILRVDLEGDGTDEVFISAAHLDDSQHTTQAGDYSVVLMRKVLGNDAVTSLVIGDVYHSEGPEMTFPRTYSLANFIDLNQDEVLEVVVSFLKWEGFGASVFQVDGQNVIQRLSAGC